MRCAVHGVRLAAEIFLKIYQKQIEKLLNKQQQATSTT